MPKALAGNTKKRRCIDMLMIRRNPFAELAALDRNVERIFSEVFARPADGSANEPTFFRLPVNVELKDGST
jgi:hypothetical protein